MHDSAARVQMMGSHLSQALPVIGCETRRILTGMEREFGRATFKIEMPVDAEIVKVIHKFPPTIGEGGIKKNPSTIIVYMCAHTKVYDVLEFDNYHCMHQHFGFNYVFTKDMKRVVPGARIPAGTVLAHSPTLDDQGNYRLGVNAKVAMMSLPGIIEDGIIVSESFCKRNTTKCIESRDRSWGKNWYPLNLYGNDKVYKPFPDIGDKIREDGLIFALRRVPQDDDIILAPLEMSVDALQEVNYFFDRCEYGQPGATVTNITVRHDDRPNAPTPQGMEVQTMKYYQAECLFHQALLDCYQNLFGKLRENLTISPAFQILLREARMYLPCPIRSKSTQMYQLNPLDDWRVDLTYEYDFVPTIGSKLTGLHGDKGVICQVWPDADMPVDAWGTRAEVIVAALSTMDRMNIGRPIEHEVNGSMEMLTAALREAMGVTQPLWSADTQHAVDRVHAKLERFNAPTPAGQKAHEEIVARIGGDPAKAFQELLNFYELASPKMRALFDDPNYQGSPEHHLQQVLKHGIFLWAPLDTPKPWVHLEWNEAEFDRDGYDAAMQEYRREVATGNQDVMEPTMESYGTRFVKFGGVVGDLTEHYPARRGPLWFRGRSGNERVTRDDIMIADTYMVLLEKTGGDWSGVASARHQHYGLPAKLSKQDKYSLPSRANPVRIFGEAEVRLTTTATAGDVVSEMLEMSNSPAAHKNVVANILRALMPSNIEDVLDHDLIKPGSNRSQMFVNHSLRCAGVEFFYVDHSDEEEVYPADPIGVRADLGLSEGEDEEDDADAEETDDDTADDEADE
ncbi:RNA polymerase beta subunit [Xanthomonas phage RTH11]|nr:RNA polymerase beta subunit [Xanthomonas phage RTH11]